MILSFLISSIAGTLFTVGRVLFDSYLRGCGFEGLKVLLISRYTDEENQAQTLSVKQRFKYIYIRSLIANSGWIALNIAALYFDLIDNSILFSADALVFTLVSSLIIGKKIVFRQWANILVAFSGVFLIFAYDFKSLNHTSTIVCLAMAIYSAFAFSAMFLMQAVIVRHDSPMRVSFHQQLVGVLMGFTAIVFALINQGSLAMSLSSEIIWNSVFCGILYAIALPFFFRAFLYTEPVIIAVLGYVLPVYMTIIGLYKGLPVKFNDVICNMLISFGCYRIITYESKESKKINFSIQINILYKKMSIMNS